MSLSTLTCRLGATFRQMSLRGAHTNARCACVSHAHMATARPPAARSDLCGRYINSYYNDECIHG